MTQTVSAFSNAEHRYMQRAITLAKRGHYTCSPNPRVGCVLVKDDQVVGEGYHVKAGSGHAEVNALLMAGKAAAGATAYVTLEPCSHYGRTPPCAQALIEAGIDNVIVAMVDPNPAVSGRGLTLLSQAGITSRTGLLSEQARALNPGFIKQMSTGLPYMRCKMAASLDGKTAMASGESKWITSAQARSDVQRLRAQSCAIISGADSVIGDNAKMTVRWQQLGELQGDYEQADIRQPIRVIIDSQNRVSADLALFEHDSPVILIRAAIEKQPSWPHFVEQIVLPLRSTSTSTSTSSTTTSASGEDKIDLTALSRFLASRGLNDILIESGARLAGAFIEQDLVDELVLYQAPCLIGAAGKSLAVMPSLQRLSEAKKLTITDLTMIGPDIRITATLNENNACLPE